MILLRRHLSGDHGSTCRTCVGSAASQATALTIAAGLFKFCNERSLFVGIGAIGPVSTTA